MIAQTTYGQVCGKRGADGITVFKGIPFAAPPIGPLRWRQPEPPRAWKTPLDALATSPKCPQPPLGGLGGEILPSEKESEDCLALNIWTPANIQATGADTELRPVAVWIHGGGFSMGSGAWPDGSAFARDGVVLVTINYRLGPLGFLCLDELFDGFDGTGNLGLWDQVAALEWIRDNIAAFGGDPENVTVFGESAGAISVGALLGSEAARGLFQRAILQSGAASHARSKAGATIVARRFCEIAGVEPGDARALMSLTTDQIREAATQMVFVEPLAIADLLEGEDPLGGNMVFTPVVDGSFLGQSPLDAIAGGAASGIDIICGVNADEWRLVIFGMGPEVAQQLPPPNLDRMSAGTGMSGDQLMERYRGIIESDDDIDIHCEILSDLIFTVPAQRLGNAQSTHGTVFFYLFDWPTPIMGGYLRACHGLEIPFVFDQLNETRQLVGDEPPKALAKQMHEAWTEFMSGHQPRVDGKAWPAYSADNRKVLLLGKQVKTLKDPFAKRLALWPHW